MKILQTRSSCAEERASWLLTTFSELWWSTVFKNSGRWRAELTYTCPVAGYDGLGKWPSPHPAASQSCPWQGAQTEVLPGDLPLTYLRADVEWKTYKLKSSQAGSLLCFSSLKLTLFRVLFSVCSLLSFPGLERPISWLHMCSPNSYNSWSAATTCFSSLFPPQLLTHGQPSIKAC